MMPPAIHSRRWIRCTAVLVTVVTPCLIASAGNEIASPAEPGALDPVRLVRFESSLERLRRQLKIPGLSAGIVSGQRLLWARGFGFADVEHGIHATPDTPYPLASVTKPFAAVVVLQLVEEGVLGLDDPVTEYGLDYGGPGIVRVRHLLSHTSRRRPGAEFAYDSERFADLGWVIARAAGRSFRELLVERVLVPLGMEDSAPAPLSMGDGVLSPFRIWLNPRNARVYRRQARPYALDRSFEVVDGFDSIFFSPASGLISSVADLARFDRALDGNQLLPEAAKMLMFSPSTTPEGRELPYGLGWFSQSDEGTRLVWHYGWNPPSASALYLKLPDEGLTFIVLANTDALSRPFDLGGGGRSVLDSVVALRFYETFVLAARRSRSLPRIDWEGGADSLVAALQVVHGTDADVEARELLAYRRLSQAMGRTDRVEDLGTVYRRLHGPSTSPAPGGLPPLSQHLLPWPTVPLFGMAHVSAMVCFLLVCLSTLAAWVGQLAGRRPGRRSGPGVARRIGGRVTAALAALTVVTGVVLYVALLSRWPHDGPVTWSTGGPLVRGFIATAGASGVLSAAVSIQALTSARTGSALARVSRLLAASGVCVGAWALLDLAGWIG
jgi:CubicO group peptidase (beta-lactamase class C family)